MKKIILILLAITLIFVIGCTETTGPTKEPIDQSILGNWVADANPWSLTTELSINNNQIIAIKYDQNDNKYYSAIYTYDHSGLKPDNPNSRKITVYLNKIIYYYPDDELSAYMYSMVEPNDIVTDGNLKIQTFDNPIKEEYSYQSWSCGLYIYGFENNQRELYNITMRFDRPGTCIE